MRDDPIAPERVPLRERLVAALLASGEGWRRSPAAERSLRLEGAEYILVPLTRRAAHRAILCDSSPGTPFPGYRRRRQLRTEMEADGAQVLALFSDAAHRELLWSWEQEEDAGAGTRILRERHGSEGTLLAPWSFPGRRRRDDDPGAAVLAGVHRGLGRLLDRCAAAAAGDDAESLRLAWRALLDSCLLDPCCGEGHRLEAAFRLLTDACAACLERMRSWALDAERAGWRRDRLGDMRRLAARAGFDPRAQSRFIGETIVLRNLYGLEIDPTRVRRSRRRLLALAGGRGSGTALGGAIRRGGQEGLPIRAALEVSGLGGAALSRGREEVELLDRAANTVRRLHLAGTMSFAEAGLALSAVSRRADLLVRRLERRLPGHPGAEPDVRFFPGSRGVFLPLAPTHHA